MFHAEQLGFLYYKEAALPPSFIKELLKILRGMGQEQGQPQNQSMQQPQADPTTSPLMLNQPLEQKALSQGQLPMPAPNVLDKFGLINFLRNQRNQTTTDVDAAVRG